MAVAASFLWIRKFKNTYIFVAISFFPPSWASARSAVMWRLLLFDYMNVACLTSMIFSNAMASLKVPGIKCLKLYRETGDVVNLNVSLRSRICLLERDDVVVTCPPKPRLLPWWASPPSCYQPLRLTQCTLQQSTVNSSEQVSVSRNWSELHENGAMRNVQNSPIELLNTALRSWAFSMRLQRMSKHWVGVMEDHERVLVQRSSSHSWEVDELLQRHYSV
jgi:hypothetical protein